MNADLSPAVGISAAARRLNVSESRVRQLIGQGKLDVYSSGEGSRYRTVKRTSLEKLEAERKIDILPRVNS